MTGQAHSPAVARTTRDLRAPREAMLAQDARELLAAIMVACLTLHACEGWSVGAAWGGAWELLGAGWVGSPEQRTAQRHSHTRHRRHRSAHSVPQQRTRPTALTAFAFRSPERSFCRSQPVAPTNSRLV